ncbi:MAG: iron-containing alcohol dehydrogenase [Myxococcota bacterium]|nr:iron-containing alcohol dehydrogenase [Myxococcota bacterium]
MLFLRKMIHGFVIRLTRLFSGLMPDRVPLAFVGSSATQELFGSMAQTGSQRVLIVTDEGLVQTGWVAKLSEAMKAAKLQPFLYSGVQPDPTFDHVDAGLALYREKECDTILALGGGSSMDAAKVIAAATGNGDSPRKLEGIMKVKHPPCMLCAIPTTAGTGSEATVAAVISEPDTHVKKFFVDPKLLPEMVALDPTLMLDLPPAITAATGMDALTHAVESIIARTSRPQTERWAFSAIDLIFENLPRAYSNGHDESARRGMALAAYYAGLAFTRTSVGYVHAFAHTFGAYYRTPHGLANAIALPHVLEVSKSQCAGPLAQIADRLGLKGANEAEKADRVIEAIRTLMREIEIPENLEALQEGDVAAITRQALAEAHLNYPVPRYLGQADGEKLVRAMLGRTA